MFVAPGLSVPAAVIVRVRDTGSVEGHRLEHANLNRWHRAPVLAEALLCWGVRRTVGTPGFPTKRLASWRFLARMRFVAWVAGPRETRLSS